MYENLKVVSFFDKKKFLLFCRRERATKFKTVAELLITRRNIRVLLKAAGFSVVLDQASIQSSVKTPRDIALTLQFHEKNKQIKSIVKMRNNRAAEDIIDAQNRERQERLASKSSFLKSLAFDIESEAKDHNRLLDNVDGDFDRFVLHV